MQAQTAATSSYHPAWNSLSTFIWAAAIVVALLLFRQDIRLFLQMLNRRLRLGAGLKVGSVEIGQSYVDPRQGTVSGGFVRIARKDADGGRHAEREQYYVPNRLLMLVHRVAPSEQPGQLYDILIYLVPHPTSEATLAAVKRVEYYFGKSWGGNIFASDDRAHGFAITTSAYGPFMCTAEIHFSDGQKVMVSRYVDFEMGAVGSTPEPPNGQRKAPPRTPWKQAQHLSNSAWLRSTVGIFVSNLTRHHMSALRVRYTCYDIIDIIGLMGWIVAQLIVRNVDDEIVRALKMRAGQKGRSAEAEHREILRETLIPRRRSKTLKDFLLEIPVVGEDKDFERPRDLGRTTRL